MYDVNITGSFKNILFILKENNKAKVIHSLGLKI